MNICERDRNRNGKNERMFNIYLFFSDLISRTHTVSSWLFMSSWLSSHAFDYSQIVNSYIWNCILQLCYLCPDGEYLVQFGVYPLQEGICGNVRDTYRFSFQTSLR